jgi:hypothetical protein
VRHRRGGLRERVRGRGGYKGRKIEGIERERGAERE